MDKATIQRQLHDAHEVFFAYLAGLSDADLLARPNAKWSALQQLEHIGRSVRPVRLAFHIPKAVMRGIWGGANRPSRSYEALVAKYQSKLDQGGRAPRPFVPRGGRLADRARWVRRTRRQVRGLSRAVGRWSEQDLDACILPHPLLGKVTLREMLYFTIHHVQHHQRLVERNLHQG